MKYRRRRATVILISLLSVLAGLLSEAIQDWRQQEPASPAVSVQQAQGTTLASSALEQLAVKGRAAKTGYSREQFSNGWGEVNGCSIRELILQRDLQNKQLDAAGCKVLSATLNPDPYTNKVINFTRGAISSEAVQIDHVVAVSDAWQKGAQQLTPQQRYDFYNDSLNLLAVDGPTNNKKGDGDAATWLPPNKDYRCRYVARQIAVKIKYTLWITESEKSAMQQVLNSCPDQILPVVQP